MTDPAAPEARRSDAARCGLLLLIVAVFFARVIRFQFLRWDDDDLLLQNVLLQPPTLEHLKAFWTAPYFGLYAPLSYTLWWAILRIDPGDANIPGVFHTLNLLLHLACTGAVFSILNKCIRSAPAAFAGAALFALHPMQIESVAWISQANNLLAAALSLAAIRLYLEYAAGRRAIYFVAFALFLLALFAKPTAVIVPLPAAILDFYFVRRPIGKIARSLFPWFVAAIAFAVLAHKFQPAPGVQAGAFWQRPAVAADAVSFYLFKLVWPLHLTIDYARTPATILQGVRWIAGLLVVVVLLLWKDLGRARIGLLVMIACLLPVLGFIPFDFQRYSTVADRYMYLPMLGVALAFATFPRPAAIFLLLVIAIRSELQLGYWRDTDTLAAHTLALDPDSTIGNKILAAQYAQQQRWPEAADAYRKALIRNPNDGDLHYNLANVLRSQGDFEDSIDEYVKAIPLLRLDLAVRAMNNLGIAYYQSGDPDSAEAEFLHILQIDPKNADARKNMAEVAARVPSQ